MIPNQLLVCLINSISLIFLVTCASVAHVLLVVALWLLSTFQFSCCVGDRVCCSIVALWLRLLPMRFCYFSIACVSIIIGYYKKKKGNSVKFTFWAAHPLNFQHYQFRHRIKHSDIRVWVQVCTGCPNYNSVKVRV